MLKQKLLVSSHAPFCHNGASIRGKSYNIILASVLAVAMGVYRFGAPALAVVVFSMSWAMIWELAMNRAMKRPISIVDSNAAVIGLMFAMMMPATTPWWAVITGTFIAVVIGKQIFGGIGCNPLNPAVLAVAIVMLSWQGLVDFDEALVNYDFGFVAQYPLGTLKHFGAFQTGAYNLTDLFMGMQTGGIGATFGLGLVIGGLWLMIRGYIRWEISISFLIGVLITAWIFHLADSEKYAGPIFHLVTGYTLLAAFFLLTEDSSSPVNFIPMILYGLIAGIMTVLIRNIGAYIDGAVFAILLLNAANPLLDKIRPRALGKGDYYA